MSSEIYNVRDFGAVGDGIVLDTSAIQAAIDKCSANGGGVVYFPKGVYLSGTLVPNSYVTLELSASAVLQASADWKDYSKATKESTALGSGYFIRGDGIEKFAIRGQGTIDGCGPAFWTDRVINDVAYLGPIFAAKEYRPRALIYITNSTDLDFTGITIRNSPCFTIWLLGCDRVNVDRIVIDNPHHGPNTDGIDIDCSSNVHISNCHISAGDDAIALKSDANRLGRKKACENITVTNCTFSSRACGVRIGYEGDAPITNCCFSNIVMRDTDIGFSIVSILPDLPPVNPPEESLKIAEGCCISNIVISNVVMDNVNSPLYIWLGRETQAEHLGCIRDISISNIIAKCNNSCCISGLPENKVRSVHLSDCLLQIQKPPLMRQEQRPYGCGVWGVRGIPYGIYAKNTEDITLNNTRVCWIDGAKAGWDGDILFED